MRLAGSTLVTLNPHDGDSKETYLREQPLIDDLWHSLWLAHPSTISNLQASQQSRAFNALFEPTAELQRFQTTWQLHFRKALVEATAKVQVLQATRQFHRGQVLMKRLTKCQALQAVWHVRLVWDLVERVTKSQSPQATRQVTPGKA